MLRSSLLTWTSPLNNRKLWELGKFLPKARMNLRITMELPNLWGDRKCGIPSHVGEGVGESIHLPPKIWLLVRGASQYWGQELRERFHKVLGGEQPSSNGLHSDKTPNTYSGGGSWCIPANLIENYCVKEDKIFVYVECNGSNNMWGSSNDWVDCVDDLRKTEIPGMRNSDEVFDVIVIKWESNFLFVTLHMVAFVQLSQPLHKFFSCLLFHPPPHLLVIFLLCNDWCMMCSINPSPHALSTMMCKGSVIFVFAAHIMLVFLSGWDSW